MKKDLALLMVEDCEADASLILHVLRTHDFRPDHLRTDSAATLKDALTGRQWDIVISDCSMPGFSASEAIALVQAFQADTPVIIVSGETRIDQAVALLKAGAQDFVCKQDLSRLPPAVTRALRDAKIRQECLNSHESTVLPDFSNSLLRQKIDSLPILDSITDAFFFINRAWNIVYWNQAAKNLFGPRQDDLIGKNIWKAFPRSMGSIFYDQYVRAMETNEHSTFEALSPSSGRWVEVRVYPSPDGLSVYQRDITERKQTEAALKENEQIKTELLERLNQTQRAGMVGSWDWDLTTNIVWWSDETYRIFGVTPEDFVPSFDSNGQFIHPEDFNRYVKAFEHCLQSGEPLELEVRLVLRDGTIKHCVSKGHTLYNDKGQPIRFIGMMTDINDRKQAEIALNDSRQFTIDILESISDAFFSVDADWRLTYVNGRATEWWQQSRESLLGKMLWDVFPFVGSKREFPEFQRAMRDRVRVEFETCFPSLHAWFVIRIYPDRRSGLSAYFCDITERKLAEQALESSHAHLESLVQKRTLELEQTTRKVTNTLESIADGFYSLDREFRFTYFNSAAEQFTGQKKENVLNRVLTDVFPTITPSVLELYRQVYATKQPQQLEFRSSLLGRWTHVSVYPYEDGISVYFRDIHDRKTAEEALRISERRLALRNRISNLFHVQQDQQVFGLVLELILKEFESPYGVFGYLDRDGSLIQPSMTWDVWDQCRVEDKQIVFPPETWGDSLWGHTLRDGMSRIANRSFQVPAGHVPINRAMFAAIKIGSQPIGNLTLAGRDRDYTTEDISFLEDIAEVIAPILKARLDRMNAVALLAESEQRFRGYVENAPQAIVITDGDAKILDINPATCLLTGYTREDLLSMRVSDVLPSDDAAQLTSLFKDLRREGKISCELQYQQNNGSIRPLMINASRLSDNRYISICTDILPLKEVTEELRQTTEYLNSLIQYANAPILVWNPAFEITRFNAACERLFGYLTEEVLGRSLAIFFPAESREPSMKRIRHTLEGDRWESIEIPIIRKDGMVRIVLWNSANIYDADGTTILATIAQGNDITERRVNEQRIQMLTESLERRVEERTAELRSFTHSVAHDLKAPARQMQDLGRFLLEGTGDTLDPDARLLVERICEAARHQMEMMDSLLQLSRISHADLEIEHFDLASIARAIAHGLSTAEPDRSAEWIIPDALEVEGDKRLLTIVMQNLLGNAWKYAGKVPAARIELGCLSDITGEIYYVRDNGVGFNSHHADRLFKPFQRLHTEKDFPGQGVGLSIVKQIIDRHGGSIWGESASGSGASFYFTLDGNYQTDIPDPRT